MLGLICAIGLVLHSALGSPCDCTKRIIDAQPRVISTPPATPPEELACAFSRCGQIPIMFKEGNMQLYVDDTRGGRPIRPKYNGAMISSYVRGADKSLNAAKIHAEDLSRVPTKLLIPATIQAFRSYIENQTCVIVGSNSLTVESLLLAAGASAVYVMDYNPSTYDHPRLHAWPVGNWSLPSAPSAIFSISSYDHDGLGRYGDPLCPDCDLEAMDAIQRHFSREIGSVLPLLFLTVPIGPDAVAWNMHRRYGNIRLPLLLENFEIVKRVGWKDFFLESPASILKTQEPVFVLKPRVATETIAVKVASDGAID